jgi:hypothetical protein
MNTGPGYFYFHVSGAAEVNIKAEEQAKKEKEPAPK